MTKISLTPVIDVVFILLIFFMLASNFNKVGEVNMNMTKESTTSSKEDIKIIVTSNIKISELYKDGLQRDQFKPFIKIMEKQSIECELKIEDDYRKSNNCLLYTSPSPRDRG